MLVLDSSAVVDLLADAPGADLIRKRVEGEVLFAPHLLDAEVLSVIRRHVLAGRLTAAQGDELLADYADLPVSRWMFATDLRHRAFELLHNLTAYDAAFVTLAESLECPLLTRDRRLANSSGHGVRIEVL